MRFDDSSKSDDQIGALSLQYSDFVNNNNVLLAATSRIDSSGKNRWPALVGINAFPIYVDFFATMEFSLIIHKAASPSEPEAIPRAPFSPSFEIDMKTLTTSTFKGIPNRFMITDRCESGTYLLRSVPMEGKYIPTHASNAKNAAINAGRLIEEETVKVALVIAMVANVSMPAANFSVGTDIFAICPKSVDPSKQQAMKQEKTVPYGVAAPSPNDFATARLMAGGHCKTKMYIAASKRLWTPPTNIIFGSSLITWIASLIDGLLDFDTSVASDPLATFSFHKKAVRRPPRVRTPADNSNGPVGPRAAAAKLANCPATMATSASPA